MVHVVAFLQNGQAVVDGMCARETAAFKADAGQQGVCLNDFFHGIGADAGFQSHLCLDAFLHQRVEAQLSQSHGGQGAVSSRTGEGVLCLTGAGLKIGGKGVAHSGYGETHRRPGDDLGVHQHHVRIGGQEQIFLKNAVRGVNDGKRAARRVRGCDGGADDDRRVSVVGGRLCGIQDLSAAHADHQVTAFLFHDACETADFVLAAFPVEIVKQDGAVRPFKAFLNHASGSFVSGCADENQSFFPVFPCVASQPGKLSCSLHISAGTVQNVCHDETLLFMEFCLWKSGLSYPFWPSVPVRSGLPALPPV